MITEQTLVEITVLTAIVTGIYMDFKTRTKVSELIKTKKITFDYGLAPAKEVYEKFGLELGKIIIDERRIVFWKFAWVWGVIGAAIYVVISEIIRS